MSIAHRAMRYDIHRRNLMYELWSYHDSKRNAMYELWSYHDNGFIIDELRYIISSMTFIMTPKNMGLSEYLVNFPMNCKYVGFETDVCEPVPLVTNGQQLQEQRRLCCSQSTRWRNWQGRCWSRFPLQCCACAMESDLVQCYAAPGQAR